MVEINDVLSVLNGRAFKRWRAILPGQIASAYSTDNHGDFDDWRVVIESLPELSSSNIQFDSAILSIGNSEDASSKQKDQIRTLLQRLHPWRKGPYRIHGVQIDSEWRSDLKWARLCESITPLRNRLVLDVGCGNGYHCWRMYSAGAKAVIGVDPTLLSVMQFNAIKHFTGAHPVYVLPVGVEDIPRQIAGFDTVFSMGMLYHRRSPLDHLLELKGFLRDGGELVLETLIIEGEMGQTLLPEGRYAKMRNVWFIPSPATLISWLKRCGFKKVRLIDVSTTSTEEQRSTDWMRFESLSDFLDPNDPTRTCEGLPAPRRAIFLANV